MIPVLFEKTDTTFTTNGIGRLTDCSRCIVTEERNGIFECEFDYPVTGALFSEITIGRIVVCTHDESGDDQPFDIYKISEPINGVVTYYASHVSYRLNEITVEPFSAASCSQAIAALGTNSIGTNPFTFNTNKSVAGSYTVTTPASCRGLLMGQENSLLDVYGTGEYKFDKFSVYLYTSRGTDTDVSIRYGNNLVDYTDELDYSACYNGVVPFWYGEVYDEETGDGTTVLVTLPEHYISSGQTLPGGRLVLVPMDMSGDFTDQPTEAELRNRATSRLNASYAWLPNQNITVNFVQLWQTEEYKNLAPLQQVKLCDTVLINVPMYNVYGLRIKIIRVVWNVLLDRYDEMQLGTAQSTLAATIEESLDINNSIIEIRQELLANSVIAGNTNQHFWFTGSGLDTGAHITEVERETFLADPTNGGGNLVARSNGIAVRDGMTELATFGANGIQIGKSGDAYAFVDYHSMQIIDTEGVAFVYMSDLRDENGVADITENFLMNGVWTGVSLAVAPTSITSVKINGTATSSYTWNGGSTITFPSAPSSGDEVSVRYNTEDEWTKAFTFGRRQGNVGVMSFATGVSVAAGAYSHAEGNADASGKCAHAEGSRTSAAGSVSHAEGNSTTAYGSYSHAEGSGSTTYGESAHAEGENTFARGNYSHTQNLETKAMSEAQTAMGKYNETDSNNTYALIIGNGTSSTPSNAAVVDWSGNIRAKGNLYVGCNADSTGGSLVRVWPTINIVSNGSQTWSLTNNTRAMLLLSSTYDGGTGIVNIYCTSGGVANGMKVAGASGVTISNSGRTVTLTSTYYTYVMVITINGTVTAS